MNCQQIDEYILNYVDNKLSPELRSEMEEHLEGCETCQNLLKISCMEKQILIEARDIPALRDNFTSQLMQTISNRPATRSSLLSRFASYRFLFAGTAAAAAIILLALYLPGFMVIAPELQSDMIAEHSAPLESGWNQTGQIPLDGDKTYAGPGPAATESANPANNSTAGGPYSNEASPGDPSRIASGVEAKSAISKHKPETQDDALSIQAASDFATQDRQDAELDLMSLHPNNIPEQYKIEKIINTNFNVITYIYKNIATNQALEITITMLDNPDITQRSLADTASLGATPVPETRRADKAVLNSTQTSISHQDRTFEIILKAPMPLDRLQELANSIKFEEGLPDESID